MFGDKLHEALRMRGMKQKDLAEALNTSEVAISRYVNGRRYLKIDTALAIANVLNVSLDWLCENKQIAKADGIKIYQQGWNDAIDAMQNAKFVVEADRKTEPITRENTRESRESHEKKDEPTWEQVKEYCNKRCLDIVDSAMRKQWYKDEPQTDKEIVLDPSFAELSDEQFAEAMKLIEPQTDCAWK